MCLHRWLYVLDHFVVDLLHFQFSSTCKFLLCIETYGPPSSSGFNSRPPDRSTVQSVAEVREVLCVVAVHIYSPVTGQRIAYPGAGGLQPPIGLSNKMRYKENSTFYNFRCSLLQWQKFQNNFKLVWIVYLGGGLICQKHNSEISKNFKKWVKISNQIWSLLKNA